MYEQDEMLRVANPWLQEDLHRRHGTAQGLRLRASRSPGVGGTTEWSSVLSAPYRRHYGSADAQTAKLVGASATELAKATRAFAYAPHGYSAKFGKYGKYGQPAGGDRVGGGTDIS